MRFAHAHDGVCASPVDFYGSIRLRNGATGEDYVVNISSYLPRILRLQNSRVCSFCRSAMIQAQRNQFGDIRFAHAHDRVRASPVDLYGSIRLRNGATGEDYVVNISSYLPRILRLQNPRVANSDDLCWIPEVVKSNPQTVDRSIHSPEDSVIDRQPSLVRFDWRRARADLHFVPVILLRPHDELRFAPDSIDPESRKSRLTRERSLNEDGQVGHKAHQISRERSRHFDNRPL